MESNRENIEEAWNKAESSYIGKGNKAQSNKKRPKNKKPKTKLYNFDQKQSFVKDIISQYPSDKPEEFYDKKIIEKLIPQYSSYHYELDASDEFAIEVPLHKKIMLEFHTKPCNTKCKENDCINYHQSSERRRPPKRMPNGLWNYRPRLCNYSDDCDKGDQCTFAHSEDELKYHPLKYKTKNCRFNDGSCPLGKYCPFAHDDLRAPSSFSISSHTQPSSLSLSQHNESTNKSRTETTIETEISTQVEEDKEEERKEKRKEVKKKREPRFDQAQIEKEIKMLFEDNARLDELIKEEENKIEALGFYICAYCKSDMPIYALSCGHLCCLNCKTLSTCKICKAHIRSKVLIKDVEI
ncbi:unnamed protein product [Blepharisma stoltei]|uniref:C3H1-type domain-containing protein n=1 Tax=Blepharisma stoltei TaxID=1481888 RepID=A0AAU9ILJ3_9CILI|nr:unnamed protein product [Blepharisma stoltei]